MNENVITRIQSRADTKANWKKANPVLLENEIGYEKDTGRYKMGDNKETHWNDLPYYSIAVGENNKILNNNSAVFGKDNVVGGKGYYIRSIDLTQNFIYLSKTQVLNPTISNNDYLDLSFEKPNYEENDRFSMIIKLDEKNRSHYHFVSSINSIVNNRIEFNEDLPFTTIAPDTWEFGNIFFVPDKPTVGVINISNCSFCIGENNKAIGENSYSEGWGNISAGNYSHTEGLGNIASYTAHSEGAYNEANGLYSHAEGLKTKSLGNRSHAEGNETYALGDESHSEGKLSKAIGLNSHAEGYYTEASGNYSHAEGYWTKAKSRVTHTEGRETEANNDYSHSEGYKSIASGIASHAEGQDIIASGNYSHAEGLTAKATGAASHAEGQLTIASGQYSHAEGYTSTASAAGAHAEGKNTQAQSTAAHAEGTGTIAKGGYSHAEGYNTQANKDRAHAENSDTIADGIASHAEGEKTQAVGRGSHSEGLETIAKTDYQHVQGKYNISDTENKYAHMVGNGTNNKRSNAHTLDWEGNAWFAGEVTIGENKDKLVTEIDFYNLKNSVNNEIRAVSSLKYYGDIDIQPSGHDFNYGIKDEENKTAKVTWNGQANLNYPATVILPYEYYIDNIGYNIEEVEIVDSNEEDINWTFPNNILTIKFSNVTASSKIIIPEGVIRIDIDSSIIESIQIPKSVIGLKITNTTLNNIYYQSNKYDWQEYILNRTGNIIPVNTNIYFEDQNSLISIGAELKENQDKAFERLHYYGDSNIIPSDNKYFKFILNNTNLTASIASNGEKIYGTELALSGDIVIPYSYETNGKKYIINKIANLGFENGTQITKIILPNTIKTIGENAFANCLLISHITLPEGVEEIQKEAFTLCSGLEEINIPKTLIKIGNSALDTGTETINIIYNGTQEDWNKIVIGNYNISDSVSIYYNHTKLTENFVNDSLSYFKRLENYDDATIFPSDITLFTFSVNDSTMEATVYFNGQKDEQVDEFIENKEIIIPYEYITNNKIYKVTKIGENAFFKARKIPSIIIPNSVYFIDDSAFLDCMSLEKIKLPKNLKILQSYVLSSSIIKELHIPQSLTTIEEHAFKYINTLTTIYYSGSEEQWKQIQIDESNKEILKQVDMFFENSNITKEYIKTEIDKIGKTNLEKEINNLHYYNNKNTIANAGYDIEDPNQDGIPENLNIYPLTNATTLWLPIIKVPASIETFTSPWDESENITTIVIPREFFSTPELTNGIKESFKSIFKNLQYLIYINPWGETVRYTFE